jgi:SSS family solute:Na+ symporter/cation/acetate symporter
MVAQFVGAALLVVLLFDIRYWVAAVVIGVLTTVYTLFGGMLATTYIQIVKTGLLLFCGALILIFVLSEYSWNPLDVFQAAAASTDDAAVQPTRAGWEAQIDQFSLILGLTLGVMGLPHVMIRFLTVKDGEAARTSAVTAIWIFAVFLFFMPFMAYGAAELVGREAILERNPGGNLAMPQLAEELGGDLMLSFVSAVAFATILAALSGLVIATTGAISHDIYGKLIRKGHVDHQRQFIVARAATLGSCIAALLIALLAEKQNVAFLASLSIAVAASGNLPAILYTIYWRKATAKGMAAGIFAGMLTAVVWILLSPVFNEADPIIPISNPGIVSIPVGFLVGYLASLATQPQGEAARHADDLFDRMRLQAVTGIGSSTVRPSH